MMSSWRNQKNRNHPSRGGQYLLGLLLLLLLLLVRRCHKAGFTAANMIDVPILSAIRLPPSVMGKGFFDCRVDRGSKHVGTYTPRLF